MANFRRRRSSTNTSGTHITKWDLDKLERRLNHRRAWLNMWPAWHDIVFHRRPDRRRAAAVAHAILRGADPDEALWPVHHKPHRYWW